MSKYPNDHMVSFIKKQNRHSENVLLGPFISKLRPFYHRGVENAPVISQKTKSKGGTAINLYIKKYNGLTE